MTAGNDLGEPLNVIISGLSSPEVLTESGFLTFARSIHFSKECLGIHLGGPAAANLGDGNGPVNQTVEYRYDYDDIALGTCLETLIGGNHLRIYNQNGSLADSGALFLAVSVEEDLEEGHTVMPNGYDLGRNRLAESAVGTHKYDGKTYTTTAENITGLLEAGSTGINHDISIDGIVTLLTIELS
ncbi:hypothetical protein FISHEDRAFT_32828 [Fistulina hepatica ATCC 64428]|uniref:Uncharacterized protein n=1 Tax=Fistulina hepatica ATCC 64428 TaxID=1128425 RepID=A0A0D7APN2_9AGAR|nr:hypothetical protein FISHEDRAFT_32828 [Fistulina hepatica ATCC 64428]